MRNPFLKGTEQSKQFDRLLEMAADYERHTGEKVFLGYVEPGFYKFVDVTLTTLPVAIEHMEHHTEDRLANYF